MKTIITALLLFSATAQAAAPLIWQSSQFGKFLTTSGFKLFDDKQYLSLSVDPSAGAGVAASIGSIGVRENAGAGEIWAKIAAGNTAWTNVLTGASGWGLLGNAATNPGVNFIGTTDAQDFVIRTNNTERFRLTSAGAYDTTFGAGVLHSDASGILSSSAVSLTADVSGVLPVANGGTNLNSLGAANQVLGVNAGATALEYKSVLGTANRLGVTHAANSITLNVDTTFLPSPLAGDANEVLVASGANASSWELLTNTNIAAAGTANIARNKLASGTANHVLINDGSGVMSSEASLDESRGGTGLTSVGTADQLFGTNAAANAFEHKAVTATAAGALTAPGILRSNTSLVLEDPAAGTNTVTIQSGVPTSSYVLTLPVNDGASGEFLQTDGSGVLTWAAASTSSGTEPVRFSISGGISVLDAIDGVHRVRANKTLDRIEAACVDSGTSGSTTFRIRYGAELASSTTVTLSADSGTPNSSDTNVNIALVTGDLVTVDVTVVAGGSPDDCSVELIF